MKQVLQFLKLRIHNYGFWISLFSLIGLVLQAYGVTFIADYDFIVNLILMALVVLGITNNPTTTNKWFGDDEKQHEILDKIEDTLTQLNKEDQETK